MLKRAYREWIPNPPADRRAPNIFHLRSHLLASGYPQPPLPASYLAIASFIVFDNPMTIQGDAP